MTLKKILFKLFDLNREKKLDNFEKRAACMHERVDRIVGMQGTC